MFWDIEEYGEVVSDTSTDGDSFNYEPSEDNNNNMTPLFAPKEQEPFFGESMFGELKTFLLSDELSDVVVKVGGETFKCHKIILAAWCPYFRGLFASGMMESQKGVVELSTLEPEDFANILQIIYTGEENVNYENVEGLIFAASYLQSKAIQNRCAKFMEDTLSRLNVERTFKYLQICRILDLEETADAVIHFMLRWFHDHMKCADFKNLSKDEMLRIITVDTVNEKVTEDDICDAVFTWLTADLENRKIYAKQFLYHIRYLALSEEYMRNKFLDHPVLAELEGKDRLHLRTVCGKYLSNKTSQHEIIGQPESCHRYGSHLQDVIVVLYCSKFYCYIPNATGKVSDISTKRWFDISMPVDLLQQPGTNSITACNFGRSEMYISTGTSFFHFDGMTCLWKKRPSSVIHKTNNCLVLDSERDTIYSVTSKGEGVFIEKIVILGSSISQWKIMICGSYSLNRKTLQAIQSDKSDKYQSWSNKTCAFMVNRSIYLLHSTDQYSWFDINTAVFCYNTDIQTLSFITLLPVVGTCIMSARWNNLVFLVDQDCRNVLRVTCDDFSVDLYGEIGHDSRPSDVKRSNFGGTYWDGKLIVAGGACSGGLIEDTKGYVQYDLDTHQTTKVPWGLDSMYPGRAHVQKLTVNIRHLVWCYETGMLY